MRKVVAISFLSLLLFIGALFLRFEVSKLTVLASPKQDQAIMSFAANAPQSTHIDPETSALSFVNTDLVSTQVADFAVLKNPASSHSAITQASVEVTPTPVPTPTVTPTPKPKITPAPATPSPAPKNPYPSPTSAPTNTPVSKAPAGSLDGDKILKLINDHRVSINLPALQKDERSCQLATSRAPEIMGEVRSGTMHKGLADRHLPYWNNENIAYYNTEEETVKWWIADTIHRKQLEGNFKYSCVQCYKNACAQELTNFSPK